MVLELDEKDDGVDVVGVVEGVQVVERESQKTVAFLWGFFCGCSCDVVGFFVLLWRCCCFWFFVLL